MTAPLWKRFGALVLAASLVATGCGRDDEEGGGGGGGGNGTQNTSGGGGGGEENAFPSTEDCDEYNATEGLTDDSIKIGSSLPQSGLYGIFDGVRKGYEAYFAYANKELDGIGGRQIELVVKDDAYDPGKTRENVTELLEGEKVFALFNLVGTPNNKGVRDDINAACVPHLYLATGSQLWGDAENYPWTIGSIPSYSTEGAIFAQYLAKENPTAKVAVLYQNDDFGKGYLDSFKKAIEGSEITVAKEESYEAGSLNVESQVTSLAGTDADTFLLAATSLACPNALNTAAKADWKPLTYMSVTCNAAPLLKAIEPGAGDDLITASYLKDVLDPKWEGDEAMVAFREKGAEYGLSAEDLESNLTSYGWTMGALLVHTLSAPETLDRQSAMATAWQLDNVEVGLMLPGIEASTNGATDPFVIESLLISRYNGTYFANESDLIDLEGKTLDYGSVEG